jgi:hypothetical protein
MILIPRLMKISTYHTDVITKTKDKRKDNHGSVIRL